MDIQRNQIAIPGAKNKIPLLTLFEKNYFNIYISIFNYGLNRMKSIELLLGSHFWLNNFFFFIIKNLCHIEFCHMNLYFYCVNTSYPMDNCFTGRHRSRQTPEKNVLYILPAGPVTECAFARWRIVLPSCLDSVMSQLGVWSVFSTERRLEAYLRIHPFYFTSTYFY